MGDYYHTIERLLENEQVCKYVEYISKQKVSNLNHQKLGLKYKK